MENRYRRRWRQIVFAALGALAVAATLMVTLRPRLSPSAAVSVPASVLAELREGDLIFRAGKSLRSAAVRVADGHGDPFSHVGLLVRDAGNWRVLHSTPAEKNGAADGVTLDDLEFFLAPDRTQGVAVYRVAAADGEAATATRLARSRLGAPFALTADDDTGAYCTTFVWRAWRDAGVPLSVKFEHLEIPLLTGNYLLPHSLRTAAGLRLLYEARQ